MTYTQPHANAAAVCVDLGGRKHFVFSLHGVKKLQSPMMSCSHFINASKGSPDLLWHICDILYICFQCPEFKAEIKKMLGLLSAISPWDICTAQEQTIILHNNSGSVLKVEVDLQQEKVMWKSLLYFADTFIQSDPQGARAECLAQGHTWCGMD